MSYVMTSTDGRPHLDSQLNVAQQQLSALE
jgi:hypothetical protein